MFKSEILSSLKGGLIVSCQAYPGEPLFGAEMMARMALAAHEGGAAGIRTNSPADTAAIKASLNIPVIGIWKQHYDNSAVYITPTMREALDVAAAGADIVALDATARSRPGQETLEEIVEAVRSTYDCLLMADVSTPEEGEQAERLGFDIVSTTLSGYTPYSPDLEGPDYGLIADLSRSLSIPIFAEGRIHTPDQAVRCLKQGAFAVVVGSAITRPQTITSRFVEKINQSNIKVQ